MWLILLLSFSSLFGSEAFLKARTEPLYPDYLAAQHIGTPDPWRLSGSYQSYFFGEQIVIFYRFPKSCRGEKKLSLTIRYKNREIERLECALNRLRGHKIFRLINEEYWKKGGILSYKVELCENSCLVATWTHHLFVDLIEIKGEKS